jgi:hypothetical protein
MGNYTAQANEPWSPRAVIRYSTPILFRLKNGHSVSAGSEITQFLLSAAAGFSTTLLDVGTDYTGCRKPNPIRLINDQPLRNFPGRKQDQAVTLNAMKRSSAFGAQSMVAPLQTVLVRRPDEAFGAADPGRWHYTGPVDLPKAQLEHDAFVRILTDAGIEVA